MASLIPREPYSDEEMEQLYPKELQIQLVQIFLRHGERTPISQRFMNAGLTPCLWYWPYCNAARHLTSVIMAKTDWSQWEGLKHSRRLETFGVDDAPVLAAGPRGEVDSICKPGELTDKGRETTLALGQRLRHLYVHQLGFMPRLIANSDMMYLRASPITRALESVQQTFWGLYPPEARTADFAPPIIVTRSPADENLFPNESSCRRLAQLTRAFAQRTADKWNETDEMKYVTKLLTKWMPENSKVVAVDSHPRLSGIMDTINSTIAHGPETKLPAVFYDEKSRAIIDKIGVEEWFSGYAESKEYRSLGIGSLMGDIVSRMTESAEQSGTDGAMKVGGKDGYAGKRGGGERNIKFALSGCHDTTLAAILTSLGAFEKENWPPYTSHVAIELFKQKAPADGLQLVPGRSAMVGEESRSQSWWANVFTSAKKSVDGPLPVPKGIARRPIDSLTAEEREQLDGYYVRVRFNDKVMSVPGCKSTGKHLEGDKSFCTLEAFKSIVDDFTPKSWRAACNSNFDRPAIPVNIEPAGYESRRTSL